jgi:hypothetical protein
LWTTRVAASFWQTISTRSPRASASAITLTIVCDLPVPGGPCITRPSAVRAFQTTCACEKSASVTRKRSASPGGAPFGSSMSRPATKESSGSGHPSIALIALRSASTEAFCQR